MDIGDKPCAERFAPLPPRPGAGGERLIGVEIEFGGLSPEDAARVVTDTLGGTASGHGPAEWTVEDTRLGDARIYLDSKFRPTASGTLARLGVEIGMEVVPVEIVLAPVPRREMPTVERLTEALGAAGATGSGERLVQGFGVHLNVTLADPDGGSDLPSTACAFGLLEGWMRERDRLDLSRRVLPFTARFPEEYVTDMARAAPDQTLDAALDLIDIHIRNRNHALDLLPAYAHLRPERLARRSTGSAAVSPRPAYHYRLPESRIGAPGWSIAYEWRRWVLVERVAADPALLGDIAGLWLKYRAGRRAPLRQAAYQDAVSARLGALADFAPDGGPEAVSA